MNVMLCCNDSHGRFTGRVTNVEFDDRAIVLACPDDRGVACDSLGWNGFVCGREGIRVGRRWFTSTPRRDHVGNIYWSSVTMEVEEAQRLARYLIIDRGWIIDEMTVAEPTTEEADVELRANGVGVDAFVERVRTAVEKAKRRAGSA